MNVKLGQLIFNLVFTIIGWLSSAVTLWMVCAENQKNGFFVFCLIISIISIVYIIFQINLYKKSRQQTYVHSSQEKVNKYLYDWIKEGSRTVIFTRDFTWANSSYAMQSMLEEKSRRHELIVCLYQPTEITNRLKDLGAEIYIHNLHDLKSRFTIIHYGTNSPQITIGLRNADGNYVNKRYSMQYDPHIYNLFVELFESIKATCAVPLNSPYK